MQSFRSLQLVKIFIKDLLNYGLINESFVIDYFEEENSVFWNLTGWC